MAEVISYGSGVDFKFAGDVQFNGTGSVPDASVDEDSLTTNCAIPVSKIAQRAVYPTVILPTDWRVWNATNTLLPTTSSSDDLGVYGVFGTNNPYLATSDLKAAGATTCYARASIALPLNYDDGETVAIRFDCGMITTAADTTCTIDVEAYKNTYSGGVHLRTIGSDLVTTAAQSMNSLTWAAKTFFLDATGLEAGQVLDIRVAIACNDGATLTAVIAAIGRAALLCDTRC